MDLAIDSTSPASDPRGRILLLRWTVYQSWAPYLVPSGFRVVLSYRSPTGSTIRVVDNLRTMSGCCPGNLTLTTNTSPGSKIVYSLDTALLASSESMPSGAWNYRLQVSAGLGTAVQYTLGPEAQLYVRL